MTVVVREMNIAIWLFIINTICVANLLCGQNDDGILDRDNTYSTTLATSYGHSVVAAGGFDGTVIAWNTTNNKRLFTKKFNRSISRLAYNGDCSLLAVACYDGCLFILNSTGAVENRIVVGEDPVLSAVFTRGNMLALAYKKDIIIIHPVDGKVIKKISGQNDTVVCLSSSLTSDLLVSADKRGDVRLWKIDQDKLIQCYHTDGGMILDLNLSRDDKYIAYCNLDGLITVREIATNICVMMVRCDDICSAIVMSSNNKLYTGSVTGVIAIWDISSGELKIQWKAHNQKSCDPDQICNVASIVLVENDNAIITSGEDGEDVKWSTLDGSRLYTFKWGES